MEIQTDLLAVEIAPEELLSPGLALDNGVDGLQVRRVGDDGDLHVFVRHVVQSLHGCPQMIFDVTRAYSPEEKGDKHFLTASIKSSKHQEIK